MVGHSFFLFKSGALSLCLVLKYASFGLRLLIELQSNWCFFSSNYLKDQIIHLFSFCPIFSENLILSPLSVLSFWWKDSFVTSSKKFEIIFKLDKPFTYIFGTPTRYMSKIEDVHIIHRSNTITYSSAILFWLIFSEAFLKLPVLYVTSIPSNKKLL